MKKYAFNEITLMQFIFLNFGIQVSVGYLSLPQKLAEQAGTDGWMAIILGWVVATFAGLIIIQVMKKHPDGTILDLLKRYLGKWVGKAGAFLLALYFLFYAYVGIVRTVLYTKVWLLPETPPYIIMLLLLIPTYVIARNGLRIIGRYVEFVIYISLWIPIAYCLTLKDAHWIHLLPLFKEGWNPIFSAMHVSGLSYLGFGATFILYPFLQNKQHASAGIVISNTLSMLAFLYITVFCYVYFSPDQMAQYNEPVVNLLKTIEFKFIERIEIIFISFYLFVFSFGWIPSMYMSVFCTSWMLGKQDHRGHFRLLWLLLAFGTYFFMPTFNQSEQMQGLLAQIGAGVEYGLPICLLFYLWIHDRFHWRKRL